MHWLGSHHALPACRAFLVASPQFFSCPLRQLLGHPCGPTFYSAAYSRCASLRFGASTLAWCPMFCFARPDRYAFVKGDNTTDRRASRRDRAATRLLTQGRLVHATIAFVFARFEALSRRKELFCWSLFLPISREATARLPKVGPRKFKEQRWFSRCVSPSLSLNSSLPLSHSLTLPYFLLPFAPSLSRSFALALSLSRARPVALRVFL